DAAVHRDGPRGAHVVLAVRLAELRADSVSARVLLARVLHDRLADDGDRLGRERSARGAIVDVADDAAAHRAVVLVDADLARSGFDAVGRRELLAAGELVRHVAAARVDAPAAGVAGVAVDRDRRVGRGRRGVVRVQGLPHRPPDVRQTTELRNTRTLGPRRLISAR